jgi:hypothetical protein
MLNETFIQEFRASGLLADAIPGMLPVDRLPRLKAVVAIGAKFGRSSDELGISVLPSRDYCYGTDDLRCLSEAIDAFQRLGGPMVEKVCNDHDGNMVMARNSMTPGFTTPSEAISPLRIVPRALPYVPPAIRLSHSYGSEARHAAAFMDILDWLRSDVTGKKGDKVVQMMEGTLEFFRRCARLVRAPSSFVACHPADPQTYGFDVHPVPESRQSRSRHCYVFDSIFPPCRWIA